MAKGLSLPGWTNNLSPVPDISMSDVVSIIQKHSKVPGKHLDKGYKFFHGSYVHNIEGEFKGHIFPNRDIFVKNKLAYSIFKSDMTYFLLSCIV